MTVYLIAALSAALLASVLALGGQIRTIVTMNVIGHAAADEQIAQPL